MSTLLERAFARAAKLPRKERDRLARWILEELASERRWNAAFEASTDALEALADEAMAEHRKGRTRRMPAPRR